MYSRLHCLIHFIVALTVSLALTIAASGQAPQAVQTEPTGALHGHVTDPSGALIPGAQITIATAAGVTAANTKADASGAYEVRGLAPGGYIVRVSFEGFAPFQSSVIQIAPGQSKRVDIAMAIEAEQQNVVVTDDSPTVSVDAGSNANSVVIKGKDLDALSDDPDELSNELQALAGPSAGPNGGQIYIDGFTGGQLPPKSAIREIRINQNPFSAEFDKLGYGRIEILTKPGTDKLHGQFFAMGNDKSFNTGNPFANDIPDYDSYQFNGSLSGSLSKWASFFVSAQQRNTSDAYIYTATLSPDALHHRIRRRLQSARSHQHCSAHRSAAGTEEHPDAALPALARQRERRPGWNNRSAHAGHGLHFLRAHACRQAMHEVINDHIVNETRFQYIRDNAHRHIGEFRAAGLRCPDTSQPAARTSQMSNDHQDHYELWNETTMTAGAHALKFGTRAARRARCQLDQHQFQRCIQFLVHGKLSADAHRSREWRDVCRDRSIASMRFALHRPCRLGVRLAEQAHLHHRPHPAQANVFDAALFLQDDWKANRLLTVSGGIRWESQNHITDHNDWAPRVAFAYALDGHKKGAQPKTVLRGGYGIFYDRFSTDDLLSAVRQSGGANSQKQTVISNPTCFDADSLSNIDLSGCGTANFKIQHHRPDRSELPLALHAAVRNQH